MKRILPLVICAATFAIGCADNASVESPTSPSPSPSPSPTATIRGIVVTSTATSTATFQLAARGDYSDGTSRDVTMLAAWQTSNTNLAVVSTAGVLTVLGSGQVEVRAAYQGATGTISLIVSGPPRPATFALGGVAIETPPSSKVMSAVTIQVTEGADAGMMTTTDAGGLYRFPTLKMGPLTLEARKNGFLLWRITGLMLDRDRQMQIVMFPIPPKDASGVDATARCNDSTWSWAKVRTEACVENSGMAYAVCPGPLCELLTVK